MADKNKVDDDGPVPAETKTYLLKPGANHEIIRRGEVVVLSGDDGDTVELTEAQAANFADKLAGEYDTDAEQVVLTTALGSDASRVPASGTGELPGSGPALTDDDAAAILDAQKAGDGKDPVAATDPAAAENQDAGKSAPAKAADAKPAGDKK